MLTNAEVRAALATIEQPIWPGWTFRVYETEWEGLHIFFQSMQVDAYTPESEIALGVRSPLPPFETPDHVRRWVLWRIIRINTHETREGFKVDGRAWSDPHHDPLVPVPENV